MLFEKLQLPALSFSNDITYRLGSCSKLASPVSFLIQPKVNRKSSPMKASSIGMFSNGRRKGFVTTIARSGSRKKANSTFFFDEEVGESEETSQPPNWISLSNISSCFSELLFLEFIDAVMFLSFVSTQRLEIDKDINFPFFTELFLLRSYERAIEISWQSNCAASQSTNRAEESNLVRSFQRIASQVQKSWDDGENLLIDKALVRSPYPGAHIRATSVNSSRLFSPKTVQIITEPLIWLRFDRIS